jgi:hypothetical protein
LKLCKSLVFAILFSVGAFASVGVSVSTPSNNSTVNSPMQVTATASSNQPITGWRIYVDGTTAYSGGAVKKMSTSIPLQTGKHTIVVRAWAKNGSYGSATLTETVGAVAQAQGSLSTGSLAFGSVMQNTTSSSKSLVITNTGSAQLNITGVSVSSAQFKVTGPTTTSIAPGGSYTYSVSFAPTAVASYNGSLTFSTNSSVAVPAVALSGSGVSGTAAASLSPSSLTFGSQTVNTTSSGQTVTLSNNGTAALSISSISTSTNYKQSNNCGSSLAVNASCNIAVTFAPTATGTLNGSLSLSASSGSQTVGLTGTGASATTNATKLFETDFGGNSYMATPNVGNCSSNNGWWQILGGDDGFSWPILMNGSSSPGLQPISYGPNIYYDSTQKTINSCADHTAIWKSEIVQGTRHDGTSGSILHRANYKDMGWQLPYIISPGSDVPDQYQKVWMKLPSNLASTLGPNSWYTFAEWKTASTLNNNENYDYRVAIYIYTDSNGTPYWYMTGSEHSSGPYYWTKSSTAPVPLGQWFQFEWAWHRTHDSNSWTWVKINNTKVMEQDGGGTTCSGCDPVNGFYNSNAPINRIFLGQIYGAKGATEQWTDHIELWNKVPY